MYEIQHNLYFAKLDQACIYREGGKISKSVGLILEAHLPGASVGSICSVLGEGFSNGIEAEVIGFRDQKVVLMPLDEVTGVNKNSFVVVREKQATLNVSPAILGRVIDARGRPCDGLGPIEHKNGDFEVRNLYQPALLAMDRKMIRDPLQLGVRSIDGLITCGKGQRVGIMAGSGVGKSVLLGTMAKNTNADINVIALVGERGREVKEFIERDLGPEGLKRSVIVVATSDASPVMRLKAAYSAISVAEYFRDKGNDVLFLMDSVTRFCMAQREIGLALGEPPATKGYTPSVFSLLPKLFERAGASENRGTISGIFTVLVEGDELDDPIADSARSYLDGHVVLSRKLAERGHYPAVDVLQSTSRVMKFVASREQNQQAIAIRNWISLYRESEDLINIGAYVKGANRDIDLSVAMQERINSFLRQDQEEKNSYSETLERMDALMRAAQAIG